MTEALRNGRFEGRTMLVAGAGGFIGGHLVARLLGLGARRVVAVDRKAPGEWFQRHAGAENLILDLSLRSPARYVCEDVDVVFNLAADMGGMGFIEKHKFACMRNVLINTHLLEGAVAAGVDRFFFASSACVYNAEKQACTEVDGLRESDAYPAMPEDGYGWEKLFSERMCRHASEDLDLPTHVARFHNIYGPHGAYEGGREKAPAAICRKVAEAKLGGRRTIDIWGDGRQTRSFTYIDDCVDGVLRLVDAEVQEPLNVGSSERVSIDELVTLVESIAGVRLARRYALDAPKGVRGRNSDNTEIRRHLGWEPRTTLLDGLETTYRWVHDQVAASRQVSAAAAGGAGHGGW